jgi:uncharacterized protein YyaL (SSP411 family)
MDTMELPGKSADLPLDGKNSASEVLATELKLYGWLEKNQFKAYDTFDGLSSPLLRPLTFERPLLRTVLLQGVRRFPINLRPILGIKREVSTKGMGFLARGYLRLYQATRDTRWLERAHDALHWLVGQKLSGYSGACWGNHFDYQSRTFYLPRNTPTVVWTSLIGHAFLDAYELEGDSQWLDTAASSCRHILNDLERKEEKQGTCISYIPGKMSMVHNANTLAASLLARTARHTGDASYLNLAQQSLQYTANHQREDGAWYYGPAANLRWVDNFHTAYVLDCFKHYRDASGDGRFDKVMMHGYAFWKKTFFLNDGTPRYYDTKTLPLDIQCCSQAIDTLIFFRDLDPASPELAMQVARWTQQNMADPDGYFYYRRYSKSLINKTPTMHWGQATMFCALAALYRELSEKDKNE